MYISYEDKAIVILIKFLGVEIYIALINTVLITNLNFFFSAYFNQTN